jgi:hypothetical protein
MRLAALLIFLSFASLTRGHPDVSICSQLSLPSAFQVHIHVLVHQDHSIATVQSLFESLSQAMVCDWKISASLHVTSEIPAEHTDPFNAVTWQHGKVEVILSNASRVETMQKINAASAKEDDFLLFLHGSSVVSKYSLLWAVNLLQRYWIRGGRPPHFMGLSLSPRDDALWPPKNMDFKKFPFHLHTMPPENGMILNSVAFLSFQQFLAVRMDGRYFRNDNHIVDANICLPIVDCRWPRGSQRFLLEFIYGRGGYIIYPSQGINGENVFVADQAQRFPFLHSSEIQMLPVDDNSSIDHIPVFNASSHQLFHRYELIRQGFTFLESLLVNKKFVQKKRYEQLVIRWRDQTPCSLDVIPNMSVTISSNFTGPKYLVYHPQGTQSDQLVALSHALVWARTLGRVAVIPDILWPSAMAATPDIVPYSKLYDLRSLRMELKAQVEELAQFSKLSLNPVRVVNSSFYGTTFNTNYFDWIGFPSAPMEISLGMQDGLNEDDVFRLFGGCKDQVLAFSSLHHGIISHAAERVMYFAGLPSVQIRKLATSMMVTFGKLSGEGVCLHVGHDKEVCEIQQKSCDPWARRVASQGYQCDPSDEVVTNSMKKFSQSAMVLFTERPQNINTPDSVSRVVKWNDVLEQVSKQLKSHMNFVGPFTFMCLQIICASCADVILNRFFPAAGSVDRIRASYFDYRRCTFWMTGDDEEGQDFSECPIDGEELIVKFHLLNYNYCV